MKVQSKAEPQHLRQLAFFDEARNDFSISLLDAQGLTIVGDEYLHRALEECFRHDDDQVYASLRNKVEDGLAFE